MVFFFMYRYRWWGGRGGGDGDGVERGMLMMVVALLVVPLAG